MHKGSQFFIAKINSNFIEYSPLDWIANESKPFIEIDPIDLLEEDISTKVYKMYYNVYSKIDNKSKPLSSKKELFKYTHWVVVTDAKGKIIGFALYRKHKYGMKLGLTGSDGTDVGKKAIKTLHRKAFNISGIFGEISPPLENSLCSYVPLVKATLAQKILEKNCKINKDGYHYCRKINIVGSEAKKILVGKPLIELIP